MIVDELQKPVGAVLRELGVAKPEVILEHPAELAYGDYSTNAALVYAKELKMKPRELAEKILERFNLSADPRLNLEKVEIAGPGFINFYLSKEFFAESVAGILRQAEDFGKSTALAGRKVMVEYTDPNPFKEFHIGHLMSNAIGESIARLIEAQGAEVKRACWQGDVGLHVAKAVWGAMRTHNPQRTTGNQGDAIKMWGQAYAMGSEAYEKDEGAKKEINGLNKKIFDKSDTEVNDLYERGRKTSLDHFEEIYKTLGTKFDYYFFEGREGVEGVPIVEAFLKKGIFEKSDGAIVFKGEPYGLHTRVFITSQGLPTYETKELGLNKKKFELEPDLLQSIIVTANEQSDYFKVLIKVLSLIYPDIGAKTKHIAHGLLRFASGKMSSRKGNVITGEGLIKQVKELVAGKIKERKFSEDEKEKITEAVVIGAIKYSILRQAIGGDVIFDFEKSISFEGDSGPYLQYSYVRAKSVLQKAETVKVEPFSRFKVQPLSPGALERLLYRFPEVVERAGTEYQPHFVTTYLTELAGAFNHWYAKEQIVDVKDPASSYKVALTEAFAVVMKNGLWLLGIPVPVKM